MTYPLTLGVVSFLLTVVWGYPLIHLLQRRGLGKQIRIEEPGNHQIKAGTPTMGGLLIVVPVLLITGTLNLANLFGFNSIGTSTLLLFFCLGSHAILGAIDDWQGVIGLRGRGEGMSPRTKSTIQLILATAIALILYFGPPQLNFVGIPGVPEFIVLGWPMIPIAVVIVVGFSNAVNLTDGLDSLAGSISTICFASYGLIAYRQDQIYLAAFCFTIVGALLAFLWFNAHPAQIFMGDIGSLSLGATLGLVALMTGQWLILPVIGIIFVVEACSVIVQVGYFKLTKHRYGQGQRLLRMSPLHYHFELGGWSETQVKERFWLIAIMGGMAGVTLALL